MRYPYGGQRQILIPQPVILGTNTGGEAATGAQFRVQVPDSRLRVKTSVIFVPANPVFPVDISGFAATLFLAEEDECYGGAYSGYAPLVPIIPGTTIAAPFALPAGGLMGYSIESTTAADAIHGWLTWQSNNTPALVGQWILQTRYQPDGQRFTDEDWADTKLLCNATLLTPQGAS